MAVQLLDRHRSRLQALDDFPDAVVDCGHFDTKRRRGGRTDDARLDDFAQAVDMARRLCSFGNRDQAKVPLFGTLIALAVDGVPVVGVIDQPVTRERWVGIAGAATTLNGAPVRTRACPTLAAAMLSTTGDEYLEGPGEYEAFSRVRAGAGAFRRVPDCYGYAMLASGFVDLVIEAGLKQWDLAALRPVIEGAGGVITDWGGRPLDLAGAEDQANAVTDDRGRIAQKSDDHQDAGDNGAACTWAHTSTAAADREADRDHQDDEADQHAQQADQIEDADRLPDAAAVIAEANGEDREDQQRYQHGEPGDDRNDADHAQSLAAARLQDAGKTRRRICDRADDR